MFDSLPKDEQDSILDPKGTASGKTSATAGPSNAIDLTGDDTKSPSQPSKKKKENEDVWLPSSYWWIIHLLSRPQPRRSVAPRKLSIPIRQRRFALRPLSSMEIARSTALNRRRRSKKRRLQKPNATRKPRTIGTKRSPSFRASLQVASLLVLRQRRHQSQTGAHPLPLYRSSRRRSDHLLSKKTRH